MKRPEFEERIVSKEGLCTLLKTLTNEYRLDNEVIGHLSEMAEIFVMGVVNKASEIVRIRHASKTRNTLHISSESCADISGFETDKAAVVMESNDIRAILEEEYKYVFDESVTKPLPTLPIDGIHLDRISELNKN